MAFTSWQFGLFFLGILAVFYLLPVKYRHLWLLVASYTFYITWEKRLFLLLFASSLYAFLIAKKIEAAGGGQRKKWLAAGIVPILLILFVFKYFNFFSNSLYDLLAIVSVTKDRLLLDLILPVGISFYTFKIIGYLVDIYKEKQKAEQSFFQFALYASFFPQIISGPISRPDELLPQFAGGLTYQSTLFYEGVERILLGLFKKVVIANRLSSYVDTIYQNPGDYPGLAYVTATFFFAINIYCDFSGYSDMAIGFSNTLGISCRPNFDHPYFSKTNVEFWRRWHISLSSWFRDYVYIPLGGGRVSPVRKFFHVMVTFLVSGLWHGAAWTFVFWGGLHGALNTLFKDKKKHLKPFYAAGKTVVTFALVCFAWIFFKAATIAEAFSIIRQIFTNTTLTYTSVLNTVFPFTNDNTCVAYFLTVLFFIFLLFIKEWQEVYYPEKSVGRIRTVWNGVLAISILLYGVFGASSFIYANF